MPKTRFDKHSKPPIDKVKAIVLERMSAQAITYADMAGLIGVSSSTVSNWMRSPSSKWPFGKVVQMMKVMNVPVEDFTSAVRY